MDMDAAGARALAERIEAQRTLDAEKALRSRVPAKSIPPAPFEATAPALSLEGLVTVVRRAERAASGIRRDIRRYTRDVRHEDVGEEPAVVTTVLCHALVEGRWQSRVVDVRVESD